MKLGVIFPQREIGNDPGTIREFATTAENLGYVDLHAYDHVLGVNPETREGFDGPYDYQDAFHEPFALFSHMAAVTEDLRFVTGILILPQRQTALVAKQAAEVDVLSNGRLTLGVGVGWNEAEFEALGMEFQTRGARIDEQIDVLRALWTNELIEYEGEWHRIPDAGLNPLPVQRPIPIWIGGGADVVLRRAGRLGNGWIVPARWKTPDADFATLERTLDRLADYRAEADRADEEFEVTGRVALRSDDPSQWVDQARQWEEVGVSRLALSTMDMGLEDPAAHIDVIGRWMDAIEDSPVTVSR